MRFHLLCSMDVDRYCCCVLVQVQPSAVIAAVEFSQRFAWRSGSVSKHSRLAGAVAARSERRISCVKCDCPQRCLSVCHVFLLLVAGQRWGHTMVADPNDVLFIFGGDAFGFAVSFNGAL